MTGDVCRERGLTIDLQGFDDAMERQRAAARASAKFKMAAGLAYEGPATTFTGYETLREEGAKVLAVYVGGEEKGEAKAGEDCVVVFDKTPFYAESGGQVGDTGDCRNDTSMLSVLDTFKVKANVFGQHCHVTEGSVKTGDVFTLSVNEERRHAIMRNHSVTHLMHKALRKVLGDHVAQKGSLVSSESTRFDFSHAHPVTADEIRRIEDIVNAEILANTETTARVMPIAEAKETGAVMLFGEKYGEVVRVLNIGTSCEFCGGTHVARTGDIGAFKIVSESGIAAGVRRIEAVTGMNAVRIMQENAKLLADCAARFKAPIYELPGKIDDLMDTMKSMEKALEQLKSRVAARMGDTLIENAVDVLGVKLLAARMDGADAKALRETMDKVKDKLGRAVALLVSVNAEGRVQLCAGVTKDLVGSIKAGELVNFAAAQVGGKGGGKPDMAMAGGSDASKVDEMLASIRGWVEAKL